MSTGYARRIGPFSGTMLVVGGIIGSGIFLNPAIVAQRVGSGRLIMATWALGALVALLAGPDLIHLYKHAFLHRG